MRTHQIGEKNPLVHVYGFLQMPGRGERIRTSGLYVPNA